MASSSTVPEEEGGLIQNVVNFDDIPEGCVTAIISFTTPTDAFRLALVSKDFLSASESDVVWERFLPSDCDLIVSRSDVGEALLAEFQNKKQLYRRLATQPLLVDRSSKSFWLEKLSGKKCWMIAARSLSIAWGNSPEYWNWSSIAESRFPEVAELLSVWWFDVGAKIQTSMLSPSTQYDAYLVFMMEENSSGFDNAFQASVRSRAGGIITQPVYLEVIRRRRGAGRTPATRADGWREERDDDEVKLSVREVENMSHNKAGLIVQGIEKKGVILHGFDFHAVPEGCIAAIATFTTPIDACRLALVSRDFKSASESDGVWERFLPFDCDLIVARSDAGEAVLAEFQTKKQLYMRLADRPLLFDGATKSFFLDKLSGKKCWMIAARSLSISWGDTPRYWKWTSIPESRFPEVAELLSVCWLEIRGKINTSMLSPGTRYAAYLVLKMTEEAFGLHNASEASVVTAGGKTETQVVLLSNFNEELQLQRIPSRGLLGFRGFNRLRLSSFEYRQAARVNQSPKPRTDGWRELKIGEFFTHPGQEDQVELSVMETKNGNWKTGLIVEGIEKKEVTLHEINFYAVPEGCISAIIAFTTPSDACRFAVVSKLFHSASDSESVQHLIQNLSNRFSLKDTGNLSYFLGVEVQPHPRGLFLSQRKYITDVLHKANMTDCKPVSTPLNASTRLTRNSGTILASPTEYRMLLGSLQYLSLTRPDVAFAVNKLSQFMHSPTTDHWAALKRLLRFLNGTLDTGLKGLLRVSYISTNDQLADVLTNPLFRSKFSELCSKLGLSQRHQLEGEC
ncbi:hypothetical protein V2J09_007775 [Rumex salicifolius]